MTRDNDVAAVVNGTKIYNEKVDQEVAKAIAQYEAQGMSLQEEQVLEVRSSIIDNLITREILLVKSEPYELSQEELDKEIATYRDQFDSEEEFIEALGTQGFDLETFTKVISEDLRIQKLLEVSIPAETTVTDEEMNAFYQDNPAYFTEPERVHASHILVTTQDKTTEEEKAQALVKIQRIEQELKNGADFAQLAIKESEGPSAPDGGDLGEFTKGQMIPAFEEIAFALPEGQISGIVETQFGYHIIKLHERFAESSVPFEEVKESINSYLGQEKSQNKLTDFIAEIKAQAKIRIPESKSAE
jgi:peptidyl-prolyl cis-trans isomerase C